MESQKHGHHLEALVKDCGEFGVPPKQGYTDKWDIPAGYSTWTEGLPVQVKSAQESSKNIGLGSAKVNFGRNEPFEMLVLLHAQKNTEQKQLKQIARLEFSPQSWQALMGNLPLKELEDFCDFVASVPAGEQRWANKEAKQRKKVLMEKYQPLVDIQPKIDSKNQRRVQMAIKMDVLVKACDRHELLGPGQRLGNLPIPYEFESTARVRNKKEVLKTVSNQDSYEKRTDIKDLVLVGFVESGTEGEAEFCNKKEEDQVDTSK